MDTVIRTEHLTHVYSRGTPFEKVAISDVNVEIHAVSWWPSSATRALARAPSCSTSTACCARPPAPSTWTGEDIFANKEATRDVRFKVGLVFQYPRVPAL